VLRTRRTWAGLAFALDLTDGVIEAGCNRGRVERKPWFRLEGEDYLLLAWLHFHCRELVVLVRRTGAAAGLALAKRFQELLLLASDLRQLNHDRRCLLLDSVASHPGSDRTRAAAPSPSRTLHMRRCGELRT
jgi:hypothetical protein